MFDINEDNNTTPINTSLTYGLYGSITYDEAPIYNNYNVNNKYKDDDTTPINSPTYELYEPIANDDVELINNYDINNNNDNNDLKNKDDDTASINSPTYEPYEPTTNDVKLIINENERVHANLKQIQNHQPVSAFYPFTVYDSFKNDDLSFSCSQYNNNANKYNKSLFSMIDGQISSTFNIISSNQDNALIINEDNDNNTTSTNNKLPNKPISNNNNNNKRLYLSIESDDNINNILRRKKDPTLQKCGHPKHDEYKGHHKNTIGPFIRLPKRLEACLNIDRGTLMCGRCIYRTDRDPEYTSHKKYISHRSIRKRCELARLKIDMNF